MENGYTRRVEIFDTTNRDGAQACKPVRYGANSVLKICELLAKANVDRIEAGFPASSPANYEAVRKVASQVEGPIIFGLAKIPKDPSNPDYGDIDRAHDALRYADRRGIHVFSVMADSHSLEAYRMTRQQVISSMVLGVNYARRLMGANGHVEFSFQNATRAPFGWMVEGYRRAVASGADVINVPDTAGYSNPEEIKKIVSTLRDVLPPWTKISIHCHNDLGLATVNSLAAINAGVDIVECAVNGIGERAGNASLEEVVMNLKVRHDFHGAVTGVDPKYFGPLSRMVAHRYRSRVQSNKAIVGENAFRHRSGIHQDGVIKGAGYEIMTPESVGWRGEKIDLTSHSGFKGLKLRLGRLGYTGIDHLREPLTAKFKQLGDKGKEITDDVLDSLMGEMGVAQP